MTLCLFYTCHIRIILQSEVSDPVFYQTKLTQSFHVTKSKSLPLTFVGAEIAFAMLFSPTLMITFGAFDSLQYLSIGSILM